MEFGDRVSTRPSVTQLCRAGRISVTSLTMPGADASAEQLTIHAPCWKVCAPKGAPYDIATIAGNDGCAVMALPDDFRPGETHIYYRDARSSALQRIPSWDVPKARILGVAILPGLQAVAVSYPSQRSETVMVGLHPLPLSPLLGSRTYEVMASLAEAVCNQQHRPTVALDGDTLTVSGKTADGDAVEFSIG